MSKVCEICELRPIMSRQAKQEHGVDFPYCEPCLVLADWENVHSDQGHDTIAKTPVGKYPKAWGIPAAHKLEADLASVAQEREQMTICWVCNPELDETQREYTPREGTSREGIVLTVPARAAAKTKAEIVVTLIKGGTVRQRKGLTTLTATIKGTEVKLQWDSNARFIAAGSTVAGKKVRNVSEALRVLNS